MTYHIQAADSRYQRKIGGVQFVDGKAQTDNEWLASWFAGRGFTVTAEKEERRNDKRNSDAVGAPADAGGTGADA